MVKRVPILFVFLIGFFFVPKQTYACESTSAVTEMSCCKEGKTVNQVEISCCTDHHSKKDASGDSRGQCNNHHSCHCSPVTMTVLSDRNGLEHYIFTTENTLFYSHNFVVSSGFHSIWLPPKIS